MLPVPESEIRQAVIGRVSRPERTFGGRVLALQPALIPPSNPQQLMPITTLDQSYEATSTPFQVQLATFQTTLVIALQQSPFSLSFSDATNFANLFSNTYKALNDQDEQLRLKLNEEILHT